MPQHKVFIIIASRELRNEVELTTEEIYNSKKQNVTIVPFLSYQLFIDALNHSFPDLVICDGRVPDALEKLNEVKGEQLCIETMKMAQQNNKKVPRCIVLVDSVMMDRMTSESVSHIEFVQKGGKLSSNLRRTLLEQAKQELPADENLVFNIRPRLEEGTWDITWEIWANGSIKRSSRTEVLKLNPEDIKDIRKESKNLDLYLNKSSEPINDIWRSMNDSIGEKVSKLLFEDLHLSRDIKTIKAILTNLNDIAYRFIVDKDTVGLALEASLDQDRDEYLFLKSPVFRVIGNDDTKREYANARDPKRKQRVLVVCSNASGQSKILKRTFSPLGGELANERILVQDFFEKHLGYIFSDENGPESSSSVLLSEKNYHNFGETFKDAFLGLLKDYKWDVVHFMGHSSVDKDAEKKSNRAYLILPSTDGLVDELSINYMNPNIKHVGLLFLSSCHSGSEQFSLELENSNVARVVGYRWKVQNTMAVYFSNKFYKNYIDRQESAPAAFANARRALFYKHEDNPAWASPILCVVNSSKLDENKQPIYEWSE